MAVAWQCCTHFAFRSPVPELKNLGEADSAFLRLIGDWALKLTQTRCYKLVGPYQKNGRNPSSAFSEPLSRSGTARQTLNCLQIRKRPQQVQLQDTFSDRCGRTPAETVWQLLYTSIELLFDLLSSPGVFLERLHVPHGARCGVVSVGIRCDFRCPC